VLNIESPFAIAEGSEAFSGEPVSPDATAALIPLRLRAITSAQILQDGTLVLEMGDALLSVPPDPHYESWNVAGPDGLRLVCSPSAAYIAIWMPDERR